MKQDLESRFADRVQISGEAIPGNSGYFEVQVLLTSKWIHSHKTLTRKKIPRSNIKAHEKRQIPM